MKISAYIKFLPALCAILLSTGCIQDIEKPDDGMITLSYILSDYNLTRGLLGTAYENTPLVKDNFRGLPLDVYTDDAFESNSKSEAYKWHNGNLTVDSDVLYELWGLYWQGIRKTNLALEYIPQNNSGDISSYEMNGWMSELKLLRAYYHFLLIQYFGPIPFIDEVLNSDFTGWNNLERPTYDQIATRIAQECDEVISEGSLPVLRDVEENDRLSLGFAYALKSRVLLYNASKLNNPEGSPEKWERAANAAKDVVNLSEFSLVNIDDYESLFNTSNTEINSEIIYRSPVNNSVVMNKENGPDVKVGTNVAYTKCGETPTQELIDCFEMQNGDLPVASYNADHTSPVFNSGYSENTGDDPYANRDKRFEKTILYNGANYGKPTGTQQDFIVYTYLGKTRTGFEVNPFDNDRKRTCTGYYTRKYRDVKYWGSSNTAKSHLIYFRLGEFYLNLAEAYCELGNLADARLALNAIRNRAGQPDIEAVPGYTDNKDWLLSRIRNERRVELCFEGHRFFDQRRWEILEETGKVITGMKITEASGVYSYERVKIDLPRESFTDRYLVLPLPREEARKLTGLGQPEAWQ